MLSIRCEIPQSHLIFAANCLGSHTCFQQSLFRIKLYIHEEEKMAKANVLLRGAPYIFAETLYKTNNNVASSCVGDVRAFRYHGSNETGKNQVTLPHLR